MMGHDFICRLRAFSASRVARSLGSPLRAPACPIDRNSIKLRGFASAGLDPAEIHWNTIHFQAIIQLIHPEGNHPTVRKAARLKKGG